MSQRSDGKSDDTVAIVLILGVALYLGLWALWYFQHEKIAMLYTYIRYAELYLFHLIGALADVPGFGGIHRWLDKTCVLDRNNLMSPCYRDFSEMSWPEITSSSMIVNAFIIVFLIYKCFRWFQYTNKHHPLIRFQKTHNIKSFVKENAPLYPHLRMFSAIDMISKPLDDIVFGMSQTSRQFAVKNKLISGWQKETDGSITPTLDREKALAVFRVQLGKHWTKSTDLSPAETLLAAIAMPRVAATDTKLNDEEFKSAMVDSDKMIRYCWDQFIPPTLKKGEVDDFQWLTPNIDLTEPREIILKYIGTETVRAILDRHAFNRTVLFALFLEARRLGVLQPAEMRWMRFYDREMWYVLQNIGRQSVLSEGAAPLAHFLYEAKSQTAIAEPQLDKAVTGLEMAMMNFKYMPSDQAKYEAMHTTKVELPVETP